MDRYEEALERAKKGLPIDEVFPELKESEDERIRKHLIARLKPLAENDGIFDYLITKDRVLAYLEKQKEQKPVHTAKEMWKEMRLEVYAQASGNRHEPNYSDDSTKMFSLCDIDEIFEKIGDSTVGSQSAEWSEEDELMRTAVIQTLKMFGGRGTTEMQIDWLKSLRPQPHWKPSKVQMKALNEVANDGVLLDLFNDLLKLL